MGFFKKNENQQASHPTTCKRCKQCDFWMESNCDTCSNCSSRSTINLGGSFSISRFDFSIITTFTFLGAILGTLRLHSIGGVLGGVILGSLVGGAILGLKESFSREAKELVFSHGSSLKDTERLIKQRLRQLNQQEMGIHSVLKRVQQKKSTQRLEMVQGTLQEGLEAIQRQRNRYQEKLLEIEINRWHNGLIPFIEGQEHVVSLNHEKQSSTLVKQKNRGIKLLDQWDGKIKGVEGEECLLRLKKAIENCERLENSLLARQATSAVKGISRFEGMGGNSQTDIDQLEVFNQLVNRDGFVNSFENIEKEYLRLQSEVEVEKHLNIKE